MLSAHIPERAQEIPTDNKEGMEIKCEKYDHISEYTFYVMNNKEKVHFKQ